MLVRNVRSHSASSTVLERVLAVLMGGVMHQDIEPPELGNVASTASMHASGSLRSPSMTTQRRPSASMAPRVSSESTFSSRQCRNSDIRAFARVEQRDRAADPGIAAGDKRYFALQLASWFIVGGTVVRPRSQLRFKPRLVQLLFRERWFRFRRGA